MLHERTATTRCCAAGIARLPPWSDSDGKEHDSDSDTNNSVAGNTHNSPWVSYLDTCTSNSPIPCPGPIWRDPSLSTARRILALDIIHSSFETSIRYSHHNTPHHTTPQATTQRRTQLIAPAARSSSSDREAGHCSTLVLALRFAPIGSHRAAAPRQRHPNSDRPGQSDWARSQSLRFQARRLGSRPGSSWAPLAPDAALASLDPTGGRDWPGSNPTA